MQDLATFVLHLHFFRGVTFFVKATNLRNQVVSDRIGEDRTFTSVRILGLDLLFKFRNATQPSTTHSLVGRGDQAADGVHFVQSGNCNQTNNRGAIGVSNQTVLEDVVRVDFRNDEWLIFIQAESARIVDHDRALSSGVREVNLCHIVVCSAKEEIQSLERFSRGFLNRDFLTSESHLLPSRAFAPEEAKFFDWELTLFQTGHHLLTNCTRCTKNADVIKFFASHSVCTPKFKNGR